jgi:hypothetical protein
MGSRNTEQQLPKCIIERYGCAIVVWDHISAILAQDARMIWDSTGAKMM